MYGYEINCYRFMPLFVLEVSALETYDVVHRLQAEVRSGGRYMSYEMQQVELNTHEQKLLAIPSSWICRKLLYLHLLANKLHH
jgi:hypothetical protein